MQREAGLRARAAELEWVTAKLPSSYHRDLQLTKAPTISASREIAELIDVAQRVIAAVEFDARRLKGESRASGSRPGRRTSCCNFTTCR